MEVLEKKLRSYSKLPMKNGFWRDLPEYDWYGTGGPPDMVPQAEIGLKAANLGPLF